MSSSRISVLKKSRGLVWLIAGVAALLLLVAFVAYLAIGGAKKDATTKSSTPSTVASTDDVNAKMSKLEASLQKAKADQIAAKTALDDDAHRIKVGK